MSAAEATMNSRLTSWAHLRPYALRIFAVWGEFWTKPAAPRPGPNFIAGPLTPHIDTHHFLRLTVRYS
jgi:hypothetical protein